MKSFNFFGKGLALFSLALVSGVASAQYFQTDDYMPAPHYHSDDLIFYPGSFEQLSFISVDTNTGRVRAPQNGGTVTTSLTGTVDLTLKGDQPTSQQFGALIDSTMRITDLGGGVYDTEMLQFDIHGGNLPQGLGLRVSPSILSDGRTTFTPTDGEFRIDSFFDVFTELTLDGGQTWLPSSAPIHLTGTPEPASILAICAGLAGLCILRKKR